MIRRNLKLRRDYGMNKGIPFIKIADHVDVNFRQGEASPRGSTGPWPLAWLGKAEVGWQFPGSIEVDATNEEPACPADDAVVSERRRFGRVRKRGGLPEGSFCVV